MKQTVMYTEYVTGGDDMSDIIEKEGVFFVSFRLFSSYKDLTAAVSTRLGGVSTGDFKSLNMSFSTGDDKEAVKENRRRYFNVLGISIKDLVGCNQVHGVHIEQVTKKDCGRGVEGKEDALPGCDGLITNEPGVALTMNFADCTPLLFFDPVRKAIGLAHGGWRGTAGNIAGLTVEKMKKPSDPKLKTFWRLSARPWVLIALKWETMLYRPLRTFSEKRRF